MACGRTQRIGLATLFLAAALTAQQPIEPRFDVVSIRVVPPNTPPTMLDIDFTPVLPGGQFVHPRADLLQMIAIAYSMKGNVSTQLVGLPNWAKNESYAVAAKPGQGFPALSPAENAERVRIMLRAMLADRFHLQLHTETRREPVFNLEVGKGGITMKEVDPPAPPAKEGHVGAAVGDIGGRMIGKKSTMAGVAVALGIFLQKPVLDQTGLKGYYDFDVKWSAPEALDGRTPSSGLGADGIALLISTMQGKFGLRLTKTTGPVEYWVVDHVEPPSGN